VQELVQGAETVLRPAAKPDLAALVRAFTLRTGDGFVESFGPALVARVGADAPGVQLRFVRKIQGGTASLRDGSVDLETGVIDHGGGPEVCTQALFQDRFVGVVRRDHPLGAARITPARYAAGRHIHVSRRGRATGLIDEALNPSGLARQVVTVVDGFAAALALARATDLIATVPERHTVNLRTDLHTFVLPFRTPEVTVSMGWHPRLGADAAHRWLRGCVLDVCADQPDGPDGHTRGKIVVTI
jgi:DNA-binding transcriptional LysR family regulator